jgi:hypothetical protein
MTERQVKTGEGKKDFPQDSLRRQNEKVKVKKLSLRLTKHHAMKTYWRVEV